MLLKRVLIFSGLIIILLAEVYLIFQDKVGRLGDNQVAPVLMQNKPVVVAIEDKKRETSFFDNTNEEVLNPGLLEEGGVPVIEPELGEAQKMGVEDMIERPLISVLTCGAGKGHDEQVAESFRLGYSGYDNSIFPGTITVEDKTGLENCLKQARDNNYDILIVSTSGAYRAKRLLKEYSGPLLVMPAGSNDYISVFPDDIESSLFVVTGAGIDKNVTGYPIEFYSLDPFNEDKPLSSFSNGYIAGQIAYIAVNKKIDLSEARLLAREASSNNGILDEKDGYGRILLNKIFGEAQ